MSLTEVSLILTPRCQGCWKYSFVFSCHILSRNIRVLRRTGGGQGGGTEACVGSWQSLSQPRSESELTAEGIKKCSLLATISKSWNSLFLLRFIYLPYMIFKLVFSSISDDLMEPAILERWHEQLRWNSFFHLLTFEGQVVYSLPYGAVTSRLFIPWLVSPGSLISHPPCPPLPLITGSWHACFPLSSFLLPSQLIPIASSFLLPTPFLIIAFIPSTAVTNIFIVIYSLESASSNFSFIGTSWPSCNFFS